MNPGKSGEATWRGFERRKFPRLTIHCRARIHIGSRHYEGYIEDISAKGAKLATIGRIRAPGPVVLMLPDLDPLHCTIQWMSDQLAGVEFEQALAAARLSAWAQGRRALPWLRKREAAASLAA